MEIITKNNQLKSRLEIWNTTIYYLDPQQQANNYQIEGKMKWKNQKPYFQFKESKIDYSKYNKRALTPRLKSFKYWLSEHSDSLLAQELKKYLNQKELANK